MNRFAINNVVFILFEKKLTRKFRISMFEF